MNFNVATGPQVELWGVLNGLIQQAAERGCSAVDIAAILALHANHLFHVAAVELAKAANTKIKVARIVPENGN